jgi:hypothetical protein
MFTIQTVLAAGEEAERMTLAFFRFLELHGGADDRHATMQTEPFGSLERRTITLWSEQALEDFRRLLHGLVPSASKTEGASDAYA